MQEASKGNLSIIQSGEAIGEGTEKGELLGIFLHAMAGSLSPKTLRVEGIINQQKVLILVDKGKTRSFVDLYVVKKSKLLVGESQFTIK